MFRSDSTRPLFTVSVLLLAFTIVAPGVDAATHRIRAQIDEPFEINGRLFPAGEISVQQVSVYNPTLSLSKVCVEGECLGLMPARISPAEAVNDDHALFFERDADGHLVLVGYAYRGGSEIQRLYEFRVEDRALILSRVPDSSPGLTFLR